MRPPSAFLDVVCPAYVPSCPRKIPHGGSGISENAPYVRLCPLMSAKLLERVSGFLNRRSQVRALSGSLTQVATVFEFAL